MAEHGHVAPDRDSRVRSTSPKSTMNQKQWGRFDLVRPHEVRQLWIAAHLHMRWVFELFLSSEGSSLTPEREKKQAATETRSGRLTCSRAVVESPSPLGIAFPAS